MLFVFGRLQWLGITARWTHERKQTAGQNMAGKNGENFGA